jgi:alcohol dehydrogenase
MTDVLRPFEHSARTRIVFGEGSLARVGEFAKELGAKSTLLVTDPGLVHAGHAAHVENFLKSAGLKVSVFDRVHENPTTRDVNECVSAARAAGADLIIGLGGGSAMDTAKGCNFILTNGGQMKDYWGVGKATKPMLPFIAIPTTAGTGSECQCAALIADEQTHQKMACLDPKAAARVAILDPALTISQPERVTICTGIDAIAHAVETAVTKKRNPFSQMYSREAFGLCLGAFPEVLDKPNDINARGRMLLGASFAGVAIEHSMLGAAHAAANPLTAHFDIPHGEAVGLMLPHVVRFNSKDAASYALYQELASCIGRNGHAASAKGMPELLESILDRAGFKRSLRDRGITSDSIPTLAEEAAKQWTASFNPRTISAEDFTRLYEAAF